MKIKWCWFLAILASVCLWGLDATGSSSNTPPELIGTWDYSSMTSLKNGKPFGTVHFQPGQWTTTFNQDNAWVMKTPSPPNPHGLNGIYRVHGHDLEMKLVDGRPYYTFHFTIEQNVLALTTKEISISANRE
jgi:hypothetical protein